MIAVDKTTAQRALQLLRAVAPFFPEGDIEKLRLFESQLSELYCDEDLLIFVGRFLERFLNRGARRENAPVESVESEALFQAERLAALLNGLYAAQTQTNFNGIVR